MPIYRLSHCLDDDFPVIDWDRRASMSEVWLEVDDRLRSGDPVGHLLPKIKYRLKLNSTWRVVDCISMVPGLGVSGRAKRAFESLGVPGMRFLEFRANREPWYLFFTVREVACLDRQRSQISFYAHDPSRVMSIEKYVFLTDQTQDCDVFTLPEANDSMFVWSPPIFLTENAKTRIDRFGLAGFRFEIED